MRKVTKMRYSTLVDIAMQEYGGVEGIISAAKLNGLTLDGELASDMLMVIDEDVESAVRNVVPLAVSITAPVNTNDTIVHNGQSLIDLMIQEYGSVEGFVSLLKLNGLSAQSDPITGAITKIDLLAVSDKSVRSFFSGKVVNTGYTGLGLAAEYELREDNFYILREDGSKIIRENG